jgi:type VI secretion system protein ImpL
MKKKTKRVLPWWIVIAVSGIIMLVLGLLLHFPSWIIWLTSLLCWGGTALWIILHISLGSKQKRQSSAEKFAGNRTVYKRVSKEINEAIAQYLQSVNRKGFLKRSALYERPWFLLCGPEKSGKTQLLSGSGLNFPLRYPDSMMSGEQTGISWNFGNDAVWVDMPGMLMEDSGVDEWRATVSAIQMVRSERVIDGVLMTVSAEKLMQAEPRIIKATANALRDRIDELIAAWGIEFPMYLIISRSDKITGFNELFRDPAGKWNEQMLGASLSGEQLKDAPRKAFLEEFEILCESLNDMRLRMLAKEGEGERRRAMCRFVIHFEGLQQKLGDFIAELFKPSAYEGRPVFRGFYFASCQQMDPDTPEETKVAIDISNTIASHPLNPHRMKDPDAPVVQRSTSVKQVRPFFTHTLFRDVIPSGISLVKKTQRFSRREMMRHYGFSSIIAAVAIIIGIYIFFSGKNSISLSNDIKRDIAQVQGKARSRTEVYEMLGRMGSSVNTLKEIDDNGVPFSMGMGLYKGGQAYTALKKVYFAKIKKYVVGPSVQYLEYRIKKLTESYEELSAEDYSYLYKYLKTYLSISEAVSGQPELIDTAALHMALLESVKYALLSSKRGSRLSENVETVLQSNIGLFLVFLKRGEYQPIQENQILVSRARKRLCRLPTAQSLYESVLSRVSPEAPNMNLDEMLGRDGGGILRSSNTISTLYTQEGWDQFMANGLMETSKDPYKIDWVLGTTQSQMPKADLDPEELYADMVAVYFNDVKEQWMQFVGSVEIDPFGDMARCGRILQKLGRDQSELVKFFEKVVELTQIEERVEEEGGEKGSKIPGAVTKMAVKKAKKATKIKVKPSKLGLTSSSFQKKKKEKAVEGLSNTIEPIRSFVKSDKGALGGLEGYRDKLLTLSEKLLSVDPKDADKVVSIFSGKEEDPLFSAWNFTNNELAGMPDEIADTLRALLMYPLDHTGTAVSNSLREQLNTLWKNDVVTPFTTRLAGRYPYLKRGDEALFDDVMDFYRPVTGKLWGFHDRRLSSFIVKTNNQWEVKKIGTVELAFNPELLKTLAKAEKISRIFFETDGTLRTQKLTISSSKKNKNHAVFNIADQEYKLEPGGMGDQFQFNWPITSGSKSVSLKIYANENVAKDFVYPGQWGLMRLFDDAKINVLNQRSFTGKWQVNVQNMYMIYFVCQIKVSGSDHPFSERVFDGFDCPAIITIQKKQGKSPDLS